MTTQKQRKKPTRKPNPLNAQMERFCQEYIKAPDNQTNAAIAAGYAEISACKRASQLMKDPRVIDRIAQLMQQRNKRTKVDADMVLKRLVDMLDADIGDILAANGDIKPVKEWPAIWRKSVAAFDVIDINDDIRLKKVKLLDKVKILELVGRHVDVNAFRDRLQVDVNITLADKLAAARKRAFTDATANE
ncbi:terminase small subunit [Arsenophonus nasoniae]|uniref:Terminase small subunit n=1 Tax=Arsenophonus nasoniae TaxID=638 RepID=A0AA95GLI7_9GAMM|nr:terminase small subunit [Arsenophonus nasoniae]WGL96476.1 terminase small subunit [Arsenophonus nasoniae]